MEDVRAVEPTLFQAEQYFDPDDPYLGPSNIFDAGF
jgi:hypothetical protein